MRKKVVPVSLICLILNSARSSFEYFKAHLLIVAFFFAMRSCEYTNISCGELHPEAEHRTKLLCIRNFRFFQGTRIVDNFKDDLFQADYISITFEFQKNQERQETATQERLTDLDLCLGWCAASFIMYIVCMPGASANTSINSFHDNSGETFLISSAIVVSTL